MAVSDYSTNPNQNTTISGINIAEGCPPSGINDAIRQMMADIKTKTTEQDTTTATKANDNAVVHLTGNETIAGKKTFSVVPTINGINSSSDSGSTSVNGGTDTTSARLVLFGKEDSTSPGVFFLSANAGSGGVQLRGNPNGNLTWGGKNVLTADSGLQLGSENTVTTGNFIKRNVNTSFLRISGGNAVNAGSNLLLYGATSASEAGYFRIYANNDVNSANLNGRPDGSLVWNGQPIQTTSDERLKTNIGDIPEAVLDAWGDVEWCRFKYAEDVERKGADNCRWHTGLVAQRVKAAFEARGLDACEYGILCHEVWDDEYDEDGNLVREAGDLWTVRYEEAFAMEAAYQLWRMDRIEARLSVLEA